MMQLDRISRKHLVLPGFKAVTFFFQELQVIVHVTSETFRMGFPMADFGLGWRNSLIPLESAANPTSHDVIWAGKPISAFHGPTG